MSEPALTPYAGTSGWSGSETSEARARTADADGTTGKRQREMVQLAIARGAHGVTVKEARVILTLHHGQASSALSVLHKEGRLVRLSEARNRCKVYVAPPFVDGREIEAPGRTRGTERAVQEERERILAALDRYVTIPPSMKSIFVRIVRDV